MKKVFLEISQNSQENTCARVSFLMKLQATPFFTEHLLWLLLDLIFIQFTRFFISNTFISIASLKLKKNLSEAKQHIEAELLLF